MLIYELPLIMIYCLIITLIIELAVAIIIKIKNKQDILNIVLVNIVTNPLVVSISVYIDFKYGDIYRNICLFMLESFVVLFEGYIYYKYLNYKKTNGYFLSVILNGFSYFIGEMIKYFIQNY